MSWKKSIAAAVMTTAVAATVVSSVSAAEAAQPNVSSTTASSSLISNVSHIQWLGAGKLIASQDSDAGRVDYVVDAKSGSYDKLFDGADASDLVIAPNRGQAAYTDSNGQVYLLDLATKASTAVGTDMSIKPELVWSADGSAIYYLQGDKGTVICKLNIADGTMTKILDDKVDYKGNLNVSTDGKLFYYTVTKAGAVTADSSKPVEADDVAIDTKGTEPQLYVFDSSVKDGKPTQLTTTTDDKTFIQGAADGLGISYVSVGQDPAANAVITNVNNDKTTKTLFSDRDVLQIAPAGDKVYVLTAGYLGYNFLYEMDRKTGVANCIFYVEDSVTQIAAGSDGSLAIVQDGKTMVWNNDQWTTVTL